MAFSKNAESTVFLFLIDQRMTLNWNVVGVAKFAIQNRHCYAIYIQNHCTDSDYFKRVSLSISKNTIVMSHALKSSDHQVN